MESGTRYTRILVYLVHDRGAGPLCDLGSELLLTGRECESSRYTRILVYLVHDRGAGPLCDLGSELLLTGRECKSSARTINGTKKERKEKGVHVAHMYGY